MFCLLNRTILTSTSFLVNSCHISNSYCQLRTVFKGATIRQVLTFVFLLLVSMVWINVISWKKNQHQTNNHSFMRIIIRSKWFKMPTFLFHTSMHETNNFEPPYWLTLSQGSNYTFVLIISSKSTNYTCPIHPTLRWTSHGISPVSFHSY